MIDQIQSAIGKIFRFLLLSIVCMTGLMQAQIPESATADSILLYVDFENYKTGEYYGLFDVKRDFKTLRSLGSFWPFRRMKINASSEFGQVLEVFYPEKKVRSLASGASWKYGSFHPRQEVFLSYWIFFPDS